MKNCSTYSFNKYLLKERFGAGQGSSLIYNKGGMDSKRFIEFLETILKDKKDHLIVLDNGEMHKTNEVRNFIKSSGNDYFIYITISSLS